MKIIILLTLIMASVSAYPVVKKWTLYELSHAIEDEDMSVAYENSVKIPLLDAVNFIMDAMYSGRENQVNVLVMSPTGSKTWTIDQLKQALDDIHTDPDLWMSLDDAYQELMNQNSEGEGQKKKTAEIRIPAVDISTWTPEDVLAFLKDPKTKRQLIPYLKEAQKQFEKAKVKGQIKETVTLVTPVGLIPLAPSYIYLQS